MVCLGFDGRRLFCIIVVVVPFFVLELSFLGGAELCGARLKSD